MTIAPHTIAIAALGFHFTCVALINAVLAVFNGVVSPYWAVVALVVGALYTLKTNNGRVTK